jgi:hypothetical protein
MSNFFVALIILLLGVAGCGVKRVDSSGGNNPNAAEPGLKTLPENLFMSTSGAFVVFVTPSSLKIAQDNVLNVRVLNRQLENARAIGIRVSLKMPDMEQMGVAFGIPTQLSENSFQVQFKPQQIPHGGVYQIRIEILAAAGQTLDDFKILQKIE